MKKPILILLIILVVALAFRIPAVLNSQSFWFDEVVSLRIAEHSITHSWQYLQWENNPPLHYWYLHLWLKIFGSSENALRFSSTLLSFLAIIAIYFLGQRLANRRVGLIAAFLMAISSYQIFLSMDARMYPMLLLFAILSTYYFWQTLNNPKKSNWLLYILFTLLTYYTHLTGLFIFFSQAIYFIYRYYFLKKKQPRALTWLFSQFIIFALFSPWLITFATHSLASFSSDAWYLHTQGGGFFLFQLPRSFMFLGEKFPAIELISLIIFALLFILSLAKIHSWNLADRGFKVNLRLEPQVIFLLAIFLFPLLVGFFLQLWVSKYYAVATIGFYLLLAIGLDSLKLKTKSLTTLVILICLLLLPYNQNIIQFQGQHQWRNLAKYIETEALPDDKILIPAFVYRLPFEYYYRGQAQLVDYEPAGLEDDLLLKTVRYNWYPILTKDNLPDPNIFLEGSRRVFVVNPTISELIHNANLVTEWFVDNHWHLIHKEQFGGFVQPTIFIFERPN